VVEGRAWSNTAAGSEICRGLSAHTNTRCPHLSIVASCGSPSNSPGYDGVRYGLRGFRSGDFTGHVENLFPEKIFRRRVRRRVFVAPTRVSRRYTTPIYLRAHHVRTLIKRDFEDAFAAIEHAHTGDASSAFGIARNPPRPLSRLC